MHLRQIINSYSPEEIISSISDVATASQQLRFQWFYAVIEHGNFPPGHPASDTGLADLVAMMLGLELDVRTSSSIPSSFALDPVWIDSWMDRLLRTSQNHVEIGEILGMDGLTIKKLGLPLAESSEMWNTLVDLEHAVPFKDSWLMQAKYHSFWVAANCIPWCVLEQQARSSEAA